MAIHKIKKGFITQKIDGKVTIFDGENSQLLTFNETASFIFDRIKKGLDKLKIVELIQKRYKIPKKTALKDFDQLISELHRLKII
ncbi:MAG TPA: PqqD family protein [Patescibacteria group bacterium]